MRPFGSDETVGPPHQVGHRLRVLVGVQRGGVAPWPPGGSTRGMYAPARRREDVALGGRERARGQDAVGVVSASRRCGPPG